MAQTGTRQSARPSQTERADQLVGDATEQVEDWSEKVADWVARGAARTREEIEDIWARPSTSAGVTAKTRR
jgi:hypothetical protein